MTAYLLPHLYDAFYSHKDYEGESARVTELVVERNPGARTLLDVACGTGKHLEVGGVLIVEPWIAPDAWIPGKPALLTIDEPDLKVVRMTAAGRRNAVSIVDFHYLIGTPDGVESHFEHMELGLFTAEQMMAAFEAAGLVVEHDPEGLIGRGLFIGVRETPETG